MNSNPDQNSQVSGMPGDALPVPADTGATESHDAQPAAEPAGDLGDLLRKAEAEAAELRDAWLRAKADVENIRKQCQNDIVKANKYAIERFAQELLAVKDALEVTLATPTATIDTLKDGVGLTLKNLQAAFDKAHITEIDPVGAKYDPHRHQAMTMLESDQPSGTVVRVFQKGYLLNDRVLRPALVAVARAREDAGAPADDA